MRILIIGAGSIAQRHLQNLRQLVPEAQLTVLRQKEEPVPGAARVTTRLDAALATMPDIAVVACPTPWHLDYAKELATRGISFFLEKPPAMDPGGLAELEVLCQRRDATAMVGYVLRFSHTLAAARERVQSGKIGRPYYLRAAIAQYLPDWRPDTDYRTGVTAKKTLGGGALLELSHELDYARWIMGEVASVQAWLGRVGDLEIDVEDAVEIILHFQSGAVGSIHLDLLQRDGLRECRINGRDGSLLWNYTEDTLACYDPANGTWQKESMGGEDRNEMYLAEMRQFLLSVKEKTPPPIPLADAMKTMRLIQAVREAATTRKEVRV